MEYEFTVFVGFTESHTVKVFEGYFSFYGVLWLKTYKFAYERFDETGSFCDVVDGFIGNEEDALLNHFLIVDFLDQSRVLDLLFLAQLADNVRLLAQIKGIVG
jgi:hypothetical protein